MKQSIVLLSPLLCIEVKTNPSRMDVWRGVEWVGQWLLCPDGSLGPVNGVAPLRPLRDEELKLIRSHLAKLSGS
jgi:hypothetical protein